MDIYIYLLTIYFLCFFTHEKKVFIWCGNCVVIVWYLCVNLWCKFCIICVLFCVVFAV